MRESDYLEIVEEINSIYRVEYQRFRDHFKKSVQLTSYIPSLPCWEVNNAFLDLAHAFRSLESGDRKEAMLWVARARKHVMIAVHDCMLTSLEFSRELADYTLRLSEIRGSESFRDLQRDASRMKKKSRLKQIKDVQRHSVSAINRDIALIDKMQRSKIKELTDADEYFITLAKPLGGPQFFRRVVEQFQSVWILPHV